MPEFAADLLPLFLAALLREKKLWRLVAAVTGLSHNAMFFSTHHHCAIMRGVTPQKLEILQAVADGFFLAPCSPVVVHTCRVELHFSSGRVLSVSPEKANLKQVADGRSYKEIAAEVGTTEQVIKNIIHILCRRNGAPNRVNLIAMAFRKGVIS
jgi:DNA-binding CsgD family transcriptional regulator